MGVAWALSGSITILFRQNATGTYRQSSVKRWAIAVLLVFALGLADNIMRRPFEPLFLSVLLFSAFRASYYLIGPVLWLYARAASGQRQLSTAAAGCHFLPFVFWFLLAAILPSVFPNPSTLPPAVSGQLPVLSGLVVNPAVLREAGALVSRVVYSMLALRLIHQHIRRVPELYSHISFRNTLSWLRWLTLSYVILFSAHLVLLALRQLVFNSPALVPPGFMTATSALRVVPLVIFVFFFSFYSHEQQPVPAEEPAEKDTGEAEPDSSKYRKSLIPEAELQQLHHKLLAHLKEQKSYLNPELSLSDLAGQLAVSRHYVSQVINQAAGEKFYSFINGWRVQEVQKALAENRYPDYTLVAIAFECGFSSSSAFYSAFKQHSGMTPKEYIKQQKL
ncbi:MAG: helix-turn-helix domain-containing protein [Spirochaetes bacterium]|nr:helix-turn-helix domain-containing protein [Spirochaetota bacterium]